MEENDDDTSGTGTIILVSMKDLRWLEWLYWYNI
jgi:hypothetical protein